MPAISGIKEKAGEEDEGREGGREENRKKCLLCLLFGFTVYLSFSMGTLIIDYLFGGLAQRENVII